MSTISATSLIAANVRRTMKAKKLTLRALALKAKISRQTLYNLLDARRSIRLDIVDKIAGALEVDSATLMKPAKARK